MMTHRRAHDYRYDGSLLKLKTVPHRLSELQSRDKHDKKQKNGHEKIEVSSDGKLERGIYRNESLQPITSSEQNRCQIKGETRLYLGVVDEAAKGIGSLARGVASGDAGRRESEVRQMGEQQPKYVCVTGLRALGVCFSGSGPERRDDPANTNSSLALTSPRPCCLVNGDAANNSAGGIGPQRFRCRIRPRPRRMAGHGGGYAPWVGGPRRRRQSSRSRAGRFKKKNN
jgi:hypothetical protein